MNEGAYITCASSNESAILFVREGEIRKIPRRMWIREPSFKALVIRECRAAPDFPISISRSTVVMKFFGQERRIRKSFFIARSFRYMLVFNLILA
jgi:hypothetical protein